ncbi:MAG: hypothetical protein WBC37_13115 [Burkholderiaceae bacterium]
MRWPARWLVAAAIGWLAAAALYAATGQLSLVLLLGPIAFVLGDVAAERRKVRLQRLVDAAFVQLVSDDDPAFSGRAVVVLRRRARLLGWPPRLIDIRIARSRDGSHWAVRAEARGPTADDIRWRVSRLTEAEARAAIQ